ncbi:MAG: 3D domain-containing protein [Phycisphaerae bacterium]
MRRSRHLNRGELWELGTLMGLLILLFLGLSLFWRLGHIPRLLASASTGKMVPAVVPQARPVIVRQAARPIPHHAIQPARPAAHGVRPTPKRMVFRRPKPTPHARRGFWYHGRYFVPWEHLRLVVTSYAPDRFCCWPYPGTTTASGKSVWTNDGHLVAADTNLIPFGMMVRVPGYDHDRPVPVLDRGGAITGYRLDVLSPTLWQAQHWGRKLLMVEIYRPVAGR